MTDPRIASFMRDILQLEREADVWDTGNPVIQVVGFKDDHLVRETFIVPPILVRKEFHATIAMLYLACVEMQGLPSAVADTMKGAQFAGLMVFSEAWSIRVQHEHRDGNELQAFLAKTQQEIAALGGLDKHPDAVDTKTVSFYDGTSTSMVSFARGATELEEMNAESSVDTPTTIAMQALCQQVKWMLS
jgi:hypothetical protein